MKENKEVKSSSTLIKDMLSQGNTLLSQLVAEAELVKGGGTVDSDMLMRRNELLLKISDQIVEMKNTIQDVEGLQKQLKAHLNKLQQLQKIMSH